MGTLQEDRPQQQACHHHHSRPKWGIPQRYGCLGARHQQGKRGGRQHHPTPKPQQDPLRPFRERGEKQSGQGP
ncbi:hypothetical protein [Synechococcus sp. W60.1]|uniref:hypothetical protein n=1 Tax=Synechococcus sp. W60.1 TaxID=2964516 RepID=UPI0039C1A881